MLRLQERLRRVAEGNFEIRQLGILRGNVGRVATRLG